MLHNQKEMKIRKAIRMSWNVFQTFLTCIQTRPLLFDMKNISNIINMIL